MDSKLPKWNEARMHADISKDNEMVSDIKEKLDSLVYVSNLKSEHELMKNALKILSIQLYGIKDLSEAINDILKQVTL